MFSPGSRRRLLRWNFSVRSKTLKKMLRGTAGRADIGGTRNRR
jgi:hypothetical protein